MIGPTVGGIVLDSYGFPVLTTVMAYSTFIMVCFCYTQF